MRLLRVLVILLLAALAGLVGYAYFGDMAADPQTMRVPVQLDLGSAPAAAPVTEAPAGTDAAGVRPGENTEAATDDTPDAGAGGGAGSGGAGNASLD